MTDVTTVNPIGPFRESATCPKCWGDDVRTTWHIAEPLQLSRYECAAVNLLKTGYPPEHLCRTCNRCHYKWPERLAGDS